MDLTWRKDADGYHRATANGEELGWVFEGPSSAPWWARGPHYTMSPEQKRAQIRAIHRRGGGTDPNRGPARKRFESRTGFADDVSGGKKAVERRLDMLWSSAA